MADDQPPPSPNSTNPPVDSPNPIPSVPPAAADALPDPTQADLDALAGALGAIDAPPITAAPVPASAPAAAAPDLGGSSELADQAAIDELLKQANFEDASAAFAGGGGVVLGGSAGLAQLSPADAVVGTGQPDAVPFELQNFQQVMQDAQVSSIELLRD